MLNPASVVIEYSSEPGLMARVAVISTRLGGSGPLAGLHDDGKTMKLGRWLDDLRGRHSQPVAVVVNVHAAVSSLRGGNALRPPGGLY